MSRKTMSILFVSITIVTIVVVVVGQRIAGLETPTRHYDDAALMRSKDSIEVTTQVGLETPTEPASEHRKVAVYSAEELIASGDSFSEYEEKVGVYVARGQQEWRTTHGYVDGRSPYWGYDLDTLRQIAEAGDLRAQTEFVSRILHRHPERSSDAMQFLVDAAAQGSTAVLNIVGGYHTRLRRDTNLTPEERKSSMVDRRAWGLVSLMRGDDQEDGYLSDQLSDDEQTGACERAIEIYELLVTRRSALGLKPFDNRPVPNSTVDFGGVGSSCESWPVQKPTCTYEPLSKKFIRPKVYKCG